MRPTTIGLILGVALTGTILLSSRTSTAQPTLPQKSNLVHGSFQHVAFDHDETHILTATAELAEQWNLNTGELLTRFEGHEAPIQSVRFSPDGQHVLTAAGKTTVHGRDDPTLRLWDVSTGRLVKTLATFGKDLVAGIGTSPSYYISTARYSPTGRQVLAVMTSRNSFPDAAVLWNIEKEEIDLVLPHISTSSGTRVILDPVQFSPDSKKLLGLTEEASQIVAWDVRTGNSLWTIDVSNREKKGMAPERVEIIQWSPSGKYILAVTSTRAVYVWDGSTQREVQRLQGRDDPIRVAQFFSDDRQVITVSDDGSVKLWDTRSGKILQRLDYSGAVQELSVSPNGERLLTRILRTDPSPFRNRWFGELRNLKTGKSIRKWVTIHARKPRTGSVG